VKKSTKDQTSSKIPIQFLMKFKSQNFPHFMHKSKFPITLVSRIGTNHHKSPSPTFNCNRVTPDQRKEEVVFTISPHLPSIRNKSENPFPNSNKILQSNYSKQQSQYHFSKTLNTSEHKTSPISTDK
jgi:hypothetical protein